MIVLVDTDVLIDVALDRRPDAEDAGALLDALEQRQASGFIAWHTAANFHYLVAPTRGRTGAAAFLLDLARFIQVAPTTTESLKYAATLPMRDFEDAMQVAAAVACGATAITTRNVRDFRRSPVAAVTPRALLNEIA